MGKRQREGGHLNTGHSHKSHKTHHEDHGHSQQQSPVSIKEKLSQLDAKYPSQTPYANVTPYSTAKPLPLLASSSQLPHLPQISDSLSDAPFTHGSAVDAKYGSSNALTYERLEFLGDAYLEIIATRLIYSRFPQLLTGRQAKLREKLVKNSTLAEFARAYGFDNKVRMDKSSVSASIWEKVLADMFEAYVAAVVLSDDVKGFLTAEEWLTSLWVDILLETDQDATLEVVQNRKEELAKMIGGKDVKLDYAQDKPMGLTADKSRQQYYVALYLTGWGYQRKRIGTAVGLGRKEAGMRAAADALDNNRAFLEEVAEVKRKSDAERRARLEKERGLEANKNGALEHTT